MARRRKTVAVQTGVHSYIPVTGGVAKPAAPAPAAPALSSQFAGDSEYFTGAAQRAFDLNQGLAANDRQGTELAAAREEALRRLNDQQPRDESASRIGANKAGLLHSTTLGNQMSDLAQSYVRQRGDVQSAYDSNEAARLAARQALEGGAPLADAAALAQAADRQIGRDSTAAQANALVPNPMLTPKPKAPPRVTPTILKPKRRRIAMGQIRPTSTIIR